MPSIQDRRHGPDHPAGLHVLRIDHVGIAVPDLDAAIAFYTDTFGMRCVHTETNTDQQVREAMMQVGGDPAAPMLQLLAPAGPDSTIAKFLAGRGPGIQQLAYTVSDVTAAGDAMRERGIRVLFDEPRTGTAGSRVNFLHPSDTGGVLVELVEPATTSDSVPH